LIEKIIRFYINWPLKYSYEKASLWEASSY
jgi:hypothetical protein